MLLFLTSLFFPIKKKNTPYMIFRNIKCKADRRTSKQFKSQIRNTELGSHVVC